MKCRLCGEWIYRYGNSSYPLRTGLCCDKCLETKVIPYRNKVRGFK